MSPSVRPWRPTHPNPTDRELDVLLGLSDGKSNATIGAELGIAEDTVKLHASRLYKRIGARDRGHSVRLGFERGWLISSDPQAEPVTLAGEHDLQILRLISFGRTFARISVLLGLSEAHVKDLAKAIYKILGARDRAHAVRKGFEHHLLRSEPVTGTSARDDE